MLQKLFGKTLTELETIVKDLALPNFTAKQIAEWLYKKNVVDIESMTNLSKKARALLSEKYEVGRTKPLDVQTSTDGTRKYLFAAQTGGFIESAYIPDEDRHTLCVSSQVGCKMGCKFCMTGRQGFTGDLTAGEIVNQVASIDESQLLTNIVYMGMGEPMDNIDEVLKSIEIMTAQWGYAWSPRRITVSTIGVVPNMIRFIENCEAHLAISLHNPFTDERSELMPSEKAFGVDSIISTLRKYDWSHQRRVSFEYTMFDKINDSNRHIKGIAALLNGLHCRINLINFNSIPDSPLQGSKRKTMEYFRDQLILKGFMATIRNSRGQDIAAACGLLSTQKQNN